VTEASPTRLQSVDALRGFDMFWIIGGREFVLAFIGLFCTPVPAWIAHQFKHVPWEGFVFWDLIMPLFIFVSGVTLPFSMAKWRDSDGSRKSLYLRVARRLVILWVLGMAVQGNLFAWNLGELRLYSNTLQAIAAGYLIGVIFLLTLSIRGQVIATVGLLLGFWAIVMLAPFPDREAGVLEPHNNFVLYFDALVFGHFVDTSNYTWAISSLGFGATLMLGVFGGHVLRAPIPETKKVQALMAMGVGCLVVGWVWSFGFPIIKHIWTSSMTLWSGGWCFLLLAFFYWSIDVKGHRKWAFFFVIIGVNAIAVYVATHVFWFGHLTNTLIGELVPRLGVFGTFLSAACTLIAPWFILLYLYRNKTFIRI
jgi:predicted acyltransferase